jgi:LysR family hydrogen peroxide-inducible transcriptional activator
MTLTELRYLVAVADLRHFSRAADRCNITQPTLSAQLRKLEETLGGPLIERTTRSVTLTTLGESIMPHARRILEEADHILELARHGDDTLASALRVGIIPTLSPYILPLVLEKLHHDFPGLRLILREDLTDNLLAALDRHELDVLLIALPERVEPYPSMLLFKEPFFLACPTEHRLSNQSVVTEDELAHERLLLLDEGHCLREQALAVCGDKYRDQTTPSDDFRATSLETICEMVAAGFGCTLLPAMAVPPLTARNTRLEVRPLDAAKAHRLIGLLWRGSFPRSEDLLVLGRFIQNQLPDCVEPIHGGRNAE